MFDFRFDKSYGDPQDVRVLALRSLGAVTLHYQLERRRSAHCVRRRSGTAAKGTASADATYYHVMRSQVTGTKPGDS